ncbi:hypothetical protein SEUCBS139899_006762 [Sporothrix eucalyptigena]|uniref:DUF6987 domain-containing protein n=1 Tax=Sporothrix eucalyptigena TaxID=1812306 RepID=A0ABP0CXA3_9PEZI
MTDVQNPPKVDETTNNPGADTGNATGSDDKSKQAEEDKQLAKKITTALERCLDKVKPICDLITQKIEEADRTKPEDLDQDALVKEVKPLIEEGGKILTEANGVVRGLDPDGRIQSKAKHHAATHEATPEEYHLADVLKELTGKVATTIDNAKKKLANLPKAEKELNPLWALLSDPLAQILAAVGLLLNGVLGLVGKLLGGLGLGGLVDGLLSGLGLNKILDNLGLGSLSASLTGKK